MPLLFVISDSAFLGVAGTIVMAMAGYIVIRDKIHRKDNRERNELLTQQFKTIKEISDTAQQNIKENTSILSALKTLLEINIVKR